MACGSEQRSNFVSCISKQAKGCFGFAFGVITGVALASSLVILQASRQQQPINSDEIRYTFREARGKTTVKDARKKGNLDSKNRFANKLSNTSSRKRPKSKKQVNQPAPNNPSNQRSTSHAQRTMISEKGRDKPARRKIQSMTVNTNVPILTNRANSQRGRAAELNLASSSRVRGTGFQQLAVCSPVRRRRSLSLVEEEDSAEEEFEDEENICTVTK